MLGLSINKIIIGLKLFYYIIASGSVNIRPAEADYIFAAFISSVLIAASLIYFLNFIGAVKLKTFDLLIAKFSKFSPKWTYGFVLVFFIIVISLTAPITSPNNPVYQKDAALTRLLPPLSEVNYVIKKTDWNDYSNLIHLKKIVFENLDHERQIYFSSIETNDTLIILHKKNLKEEFSINEIETINNQPLIHSKVFILGTDEFGRDILSRIIYGIRISVFIGLLSVILSFLIGSLIGYASGIAGGLTDLLLMRVTDFFLSFPILFFVIFLIAFLGNSIFLLITVFGFAGWMYVARLARNESIACLKKEFIQTLIIAGQSKFKIAVKHILPNTISPILITLIFQMSNVVIAESALSFLGLGVQPPTPTLGGIIKSGYDYISSAWWIAFEGSAALVLVVLSFNLIAEGLKKEIYSKI